MDQPTDLTAPLAALSHALDADRTDLPAVLAVLQDYLSVTVPSYLGLLISFRAADHPFTLDTLDTVAADPVRASLRLPLSGFTGAPAGDIVFYAALPGAFIELAADARYSYDLDGQVQLDEHLFQARRRSNWRRHRATVRDRDAPAAAPRSPRSSDRGDIT